MNDWREVAAVSDENAEHATKQQDEAYDAEHERLPELRHLDAAPPIAADKTIRLRTMRNRTKKTETRT
jgi:hypothetical protein